MDHTRILAALAVAGTLLIAPGGHAGAGPAAPAGLSRIGGLSSIEFVQDKQKSETIKHKMKRVWRNLTGYKFDVAVPLLRLSSRARTVPRPARTAKTRARNASLGTCSVRSEMQIASGWKRCGSPTPAANGKFADTEIQ